MMVYIISVNSTAFYFTHKSLNCSENGIGAGTVSNIIDEWKKGVLCSDFESVSITDTVIL